MENLSFSGKEMTAIIYWAAKMAAADDRVSNSEIEMITTEMHRFGVSSSDAKKMFMLAETMDSVDAIKIVSSMTYAQKKYVAAYLGAQMTIDFDINEKEMALWRLVSTLCGLPTMSIKEAIAYMAD